MASNNPDLEIKDRRYEALLLSMLIRGRNIQGQQGEITIKSRPAAETKLMKPKAALRQMVGRAHPAAVARTMVRSRR